MSNVARRTYAPPSKATASTVCQKCLKRGHYSYECTAKSQDRPYVSRPSRTQQLLNPKLKPKLASDEPNTLLKKEGVADEQLKKIKEERGRKRRRFGDDEGSMRSASSSSSESVSTISTNASRSPTPPIRRRSAGKPERGHDSSKTSQPRPSSSAARNHHRSDRSQSNTSSEEQEGSRPRKNYSKRASRSPARHSEVTRGTSHRESFVHRQRSRSRSANSAFGAHQRRSISPIEEPYQPRASVNRREVVGDKGNSKSGRAPSGIDRRSQHVTRERSLSPYSKRLALTQAMNMGR